MYNAIFRQKLKPNIIFINKIVYITLTLTMEGIKLGIGGRAD